MKHYLIILLIFCSLFSKVYGQSSSAAIDSLVKFRVIKARERPALERELGRNSFVSYRVAILGGLKGLMLQKTFHLNPHKTGIFYSYSIDYRKSKNQDSINTSLRLLLEKIKKADLLTERVYNNALKGIDSGRYVAELEMIGHLSEMSFRFEWLAPGKLLPVAASLHKNGIVSDSGFLQLKSDIKNEKIESAFQLNDYCLLDRKFNPAKYTGEPGVWLEQLHRDIASILPGLNFTGFSYTTEPDKALTIGATPGTRFKISLVCNGHTYKHTEAAFNFKNRKAQIGLSDIVGAGFHRIFNKILADQQSPFRLHQVMSGYAGGAADDSFKHFAVIALQESQAGVLMQGKSSSYMFVSAENYDNSLTSASIDSTIAGWKKIGLFAHLSDVEISKAIDDSESDNLFSIDKLLENFPGVVYSLYSAMKAPGQRYRDILGHLVEITHGAFNPTKIAQTKIKSGIRLQYLYNGKMHSHTFRTSYGWFDKDFPAFVKNLGKENNLPGNFYSLPYQEAVIYLTQQQHDYAAEHKLLNFETSK